MQVDASRLLRERPALYLGTRLKRLAERMQAESVRWIQGLGLPVQPGNVLILASLFRDGPRTISSLARELQVAQPTVTRAVQTLIEDALVEVSREHVDQRLKTISLTQKGRDAWIATSVRVFGPAEVAVERMLAELDGPLLPLLDALERQMDDRPMDLRAADQRGAGLSIRAYDDSLAPVFKTLTADWMAEEGVLLPDDLHRLSDPRRFILDPGGAILFVEARGVGPVGTGALLRIEHGVYELASFGITRPARGGGAGGMLGRALIALAHELGAETLYVMTRRSLASALRLYESLGFRRDDALHARFSGRDTRAEITLAHAGIGLRAAVPGTVRSDASDLSRTETE